MHRGVSPSTRVNWLYRLLAVEVGDTGTPATANTALIPLRRVCSRNSLYISVEKIDEVFEQIGYKWQEARRQGATKFGSRSGNSTLNFD